MYEELMGTLRKEAVVGITCWELKSIKGFSASYFHVWHQNLGRQLEKLSLKSL